MVGYVVFLKKVELSTLRNKMKNEIVQKYGKLLIDNERTIIK